MWPETYNMAPHSRRQEQKSYWLRKPHRVDNPDSSSLDFSFEEAIRDRWLAYTEVRAAADSNSNRPSVFDQQAQEEGNYLRSLLTRLAKMEIAFEELQRSTSDQLSAAWAEINELQNAVEELEER